MAQNSMEKKNVSEVEKWSIIDKWLKNKIFRNNESIPIFERNQETVATLYNLVMNNKLQDEMIDIVYSKQQIHTKEYNAEAKRINEILNILNVSKNDFSKNGINSLNGLVNLAKILELADAQKSSYLSSLAKLNLDYSRIECENNRLTRSIDSIKGQINKTIKRNEKNENLLDRLRNEWNSKDQLSLKEYEKNMELLELKKSEYQNKQIELEKEYLSTGVEEENLRINELKRKEQELIMLEQEIRNKPKLALEKAKIKLDTLKEERQELLNRIAEHFQ
ncbi:7388_t:CDS:2 [Entrophospora sp. SA101]|nr:7388_t:CDS:2 [Entrophospora sp. SA101]